MNKSNGHNGEKSAVDAEVFFEIPIITTSSPSIDTDSEAAPIYRNIAKQSGDFHSDEETDTSFINNNNGINRRVSFLRSLSPANLNSSSASRGVNESFLWTLISFLIIQSNFRMCEDGRNHWRVHQNHGQTEPSTWCLRVYKSVS